METEPDRISLKPVLWLCGILLLTHIAVDGLLQKRHVLLPSGILLLIENLLAAVACFWRSRRSRGPGRLLWSLTGAAETIHFISRSATGLEMTVFHLPHNATSPSDFFILPWGIPLMLAIGAPSESRSTRIFYWLDCMQITLVVVLAFVLVFGALPFQKAATPTISDMGAVWLYSIENLCITIVALLRLQTRDPVRERRSFYTSLSICLCLYLIFGPIYNFLDASSNQPPVRLQFLLALHLLAMVVLAVSPAVWPRSPGRLTRHRTLALVLDNSLPIVYPSSVVVCSVAILPRHPRLGIAIILASLFFYGTRSTILQVRFQRIQNKMAHAQRQLEQITLTDPLTGIANRRGFNQKFAAAWEEYVTTRRPFCLCLIDVDHFKILNDTLGHTEGDRCLLAVAKALSTTLPHPDDMIARIGGDEFAIIVFEPAESVFPLCSAMVRAIESLHLQVQGDRGGKVTISMGGTEAGRSQSQEEMMRNADDSLYHAKRAGRNRIFIA